MLCSMKLRSSPFEKIKNGTKTVELRLDDEKRRDIRVGDFIEFSRTDAPEDRLHARVTALHRFDSFAQLYAALPKEKLGYGESEPADPAHMEKYYPKEKQERYGVLGIELYPTDLYKFVQAQGGGFGATYLTALKEMRQGEKLSHWIWYVFPQIQGLGYSSTARYFAIKDLSEARDYLAHPILGARLNEIASVLLSIRSDYPVAVFGYTDAMKVRSCMTLFKHAQPEQELFQRVLDKFYSGAEDDKTVSILGL